MMELTMAMTESYTPGYVLRINELHWDCQCAGCEGRAPLTTSAWQNQVRHSARITCETAAQQILLGGNAFDLQSGAHSAGDAVLDEKVQLVNQALINVFIAADQPFNVRLYTAGIFLSKAQQQHDLNAIVDTQLELVELLNNGSMQQAFDSLPKIEKFKLDLLPAIATLIQHADVQLDMTLMLKSSELQILSRDYQAQWLNDLESDAHLNGLAAERDPLWMHAALYHCFHFVFPGEQPAEWAEHFMQFCQRYFLVNTALALFVQAGAEVNGQIFSALMASAARQTLPEMETQDALLVGLALLR